MNKTRVLGFFFLLAATVMSQPALAKAVSKDTGSEHCSDGTLGGIICNVIESSHDVPGVLTALTYLAGLFFGFMGIIKLKEHVDSPNNVQIWDPLKRFFAGGAFFALPSFLQAVITTIQGDGMQGFDITEFRGESSGTGLDAMMVGLIGDVWEPMLAVMLAFCYLAGVVLVIIGISRFLKTEQQGPNGPAGIGTIMTFLVAGALLSIDSMVGALSDSMFGTAKTATGGVLQYTAGMEGNEIAHVEAVVAAVIGFIALIGWVSIIRGFFIVRGVAEGNSQASMMAGMTHLLGGALAVNLGPVMNAVQTTLGITGYGILFE